MTQVPLKDHEPTVHPRKTYTGALLQAGPKWQQSHYGFEE